MNGQIELIKFFAQFGQNGVSRRGKRHIRSEHRVIADVYVRVIHKRQIEVCVNILSEMDVSAAEICVKRRFYIAIFAYLGKHLFQQRRLFLCFGRAQGIVLKKFVEAFLLIFHQFGVVRHDIRLSRVHFFFHGHFFLPFLPSDNAFLLFSSASFNVPVRSARRCTAFSESIFFFSSGRSTSESKRSV